MSKKILIPEMVVINKIIQLRGKRVIIDKDIAELYDVPTKRLNEQVKRNLMRFPEDFMFQLTKEEKSEVVAKCDHLNGLKFSNQLPYAFTEYGAVMLASVLNSEKAIIANIQIVRVFIKMREMLLTQKDILLKIEQLEQSNKSNRIDIQTLFKALRSLIEPIKEERKRIGYKI